MEIGKGELPGHQGCAAALGYRSSRPPHLGDQRPGARYLRRSAHRRARL